MRTRDVRLIRESLHAIRGYSVGTTREFDAHHSVIEFVLPDHKSVTLIVKIQEVLDAFPLLPERDGKRRGNGKGSVFRRANGRFRWEIVLGYENKPDGKRKAIRISGCADTHAEAHQKMEAAKKSQNGERR